MFTRCVVITIETQTQERGLYQAFFLIFLVKATSQESVKRAGALSMLASKVITSESRRCFCFSRKKSICFAVALYDVAPRNLNKRTNRFPWPGENKKKSFFFIFASCHVLKHRCFFVTKKVSCISVLRVKFKSRLFKNTVGGFLPFVFFLVW